MQLSEDFSIASLFIPWCLASLVDFISSDKAAASANKDSGQSSSNHRSLLSLSGRLRSRGSKSTGAWIARPTGGARSGKLLLAICWRCLVMLAWWKVWVLAAPWLRSLASKVNPESVLRSLVQLKVGKWLYDRIQDKIASRGHSSTKCVGKVVIAVELN